MKGRFSWLLGVAMLLVASLAAPVSASARIQSDPALQARLAGQAFVDQMAASVPDLSKWKGASVCSARPYYDLGGDINSYMFAIQNQGEVVGHVLIGNSAYGFAVFEAGEAAPPKVPADATRVLYLGLDGQYALRKVDGEVIGVNIVYGDILRLAQMTSFLATPDEYRSRQSQTEAARLSDTFGPQGALGTMNFLPMGYYSNPPTQKWCGPCSGVSIGHYYKWYSYTGRAYPNLPDDYWMYEELYSYMQAQPWVYPWNYGPGLVALAAVHGYSNFRADGPYSANPSHYFNLIVPSIDSGWPLALCTYPLNPHWRAIKGYNYSTGTHNIWCTNSQTYDSWESLNWDSLPDWWHDIVRIRDNG
jgi:hypothetical protein